jgi:HYR domain
MRKETKMRRLVLLLATVGMMLALCAGAASAQTYTAETLDANTLGLGESVNAYTAGPGQKAVQTFTAEHNGQLTTAKLKIHLDSAWGSINGAKVQITTVDPATGLPTSNVLASSTIPSSDIPVLPANIDPASIQMTTVTFGSPATVEAGKQYAIVMDTIASSTNTPFLRWTTILQDYSGGQGMWINAFNGSFASFLPAQPDRDNVSDQVFAIYVTDNASPVLTLPDNITKEAEGPNGAKVDWQTPTATDDVDGSVPVTCSKNSGDTFPFGTTKVDCEATDAAGNKVTDSFDVTVRDTTYPTPNELFPFFEQYNVDATSSSEATVNYLQLVPDANSLLTATDLVDGEVPLECSPPSGTHFLLGLTDVVCTATDAAGNTGFAVFTVQVRYNWSGVLQPVNADGSSIFKLGSTVPVKFALVGGSAGVKDATVTVTIDKVVNDIEGTVMENTYTATPTRGDVFRYDAKSGQYVFNWSTQNLKSGPGTYVLSLNMGDSNIPDVWISLK